MYMKNIVYINLNTRNPPFQIRSYRKVQTFRESMNRLHQSINQYPVDLFNSFVARLRSANTHLFDERSSEGHDELHVYEEHCCLY